MLHPYAADLGVPDISYPEALVPNTFHQNRTICLIIRKILVLGVQVLVATQKSRRFVNRPIVCDGRNAAISPR